MISFYIHRLLLSYPDNSDTIALTETGEGGLEEFVSKLRPDQAAFGYVRAVIGNDTLSQRAKFVFVSWCGPEVKVMRKAKLSVHIADVKNFIKNFAIEVSASQPEDLAANEVELKLRKAMGANYDRQASQY